MIHLAGHVVKIGNYVVQRCLICGEALLEVNLQNIASPEGSGPYPVLTVGGWYEKGDGRIVLVGEASDSIFDSDLDVPESCCIRSKHESL